MNTDWIVDSQWSGVVASWFGVVVAAISVGLAARAFWLSKAANHTAVKLAQHQINSEYVYWRVYADFVQKCFVLENLGMSDAKQVVAFALIEDGSFEDRWPRVPMACHDCKSLGHISMDSETFFGEHGKWKQFVEENWVYVGDGMRNASADSPPLSVKVIIQWKDSLGFNNHQELSILARG